MYTMKIAKIALALCILYIISTETYLMTMLILLAINDHFRLELVGLLAVWSSESSLGNIVVYFRSREFRQILNKSLCIASLTSGAAMKCGLSVAVMQNKDILR